MPRPRALARLGEPIPMCASIQFASKPAPDLALRASLHRCLLTPFTLLVLAALLFSTPLLFSSTVPAAKPAPTHAKVHKTVHKTAYRHRKRRAAHPIAPPVQAAPVVPPPPEPPHWPVNDKPAEATVTWDSHGLRIIAENSSLLQILKDVSQATGAKVEGLAADQRIFGAYGPGKARDVLSQLLDGSGYNVLMIGDQGGGTPREIVLSSQNGAPSPPPAVTPVVPPAAIEEEPEVPEEQPEPTTIPQPGEPGNRHGALREPRPQL